MKKNKNTIILLSIIVLLIVMVSLAVYAVVSNVNVTAFTGATALSDTSVQLTWDKVPSANGYVIYQKKAEDAYKKIKAFNDVNITSYKVSELDSSTEYFYKIRTYKVLNKKDIYSGFSREINVTTNPAAPTLTSAAEIDNKVVLRWREMAGVNGCVIYKKSNAGSKIIKTVTTGDTFTVFKGKVGDKLTSRAYVIVNGEKVYGKYAQEVTVSQDILEKQVNWLKDIFEECNVTIEKSDEYVQQLRYIFEDTSSTMKNLESFLKTLMSEISPKGEAKNELNECFDEIKSIFESTYNDGRQWADKNWIALGTSITSETEGKYVEPLVQLSGLKVTNHGVGGAVMGGHILLRAQTEKTLETANLVTVEGAVNDYAKSIPLGKVGDTVPYYHSFESPRWNNWGADDGTFAGSCYQVFDAVKKKAPDAVVVCLTATTGRDIPETGAHYGEDRKNSIGLTLKDYNDMMIAVAESMGVKVIDTATLSGITQENPEYYVDHIHHSDLGGQKFAETIWAELKYIPVVE